MVRAKFKCTKITDYTDFQQVMVEMNPVMDGSEENKSFAKYTPAGELRLNVSYETPAHKLFEEGQEYYIDIQKA